MVLRLGISQRVKGLESRVCLDIGVQLRCSFDFRTAKVLRSNRSSVTQASLRV